jgi:HEAT repeat protein
MRSLFSLSIDRLSFWIGFITGGLLIWLLGFLRPTFRQFWFSLIKEIRDVREGLTAGVEVRLRNDTLRYAQHQHLAATLFPLDDILVEPFVLAPPVPVKPGYEEASGELTESVIPYLPDWPELAAALNGPRLSLIQAMENHANLVLIGRPGSGKTVALAHLASLCAHQSLFTDHEASLVPLFIHASDLNLPPHEGDQPINLLSEALSSYASTLNLPRLPAFVRSVCEEGRALLLLDGLDELAPLPLQDTAEYLLSLLNQYPLLRVVVAASTENYAQLNEAGLVPVAMAGWNKGLRREFINNWCENWEKYIAPVTATGTDEVDPQILNGWLLNENLSLTPLEFTLKVWAAFAGDLLGPGATEAIESYLRRMTVNFEDARPALEKLAIQMVSSQQSIFTRNEFQEWLSEFELPSQPSVEDNPDLPVEKQAEKTSKEPAHLASRMMPILLDTDLVVERANSCLTMNHPVICGYLAASGMCNIEDKNPTGFSSLRNLPDWVGKDLAVEWLAVTRDLSGLVKNYLESKDDLLFRKPLKVAHWLGRVSVNTRWRSNALRYLANFQQKEGLAIGLRARALVGFATSGDPGVLAVLHQMMASTHSQVRQLGALGCGLIQDPQSVQFINSLIGDTVSAVRYAALRALVAIGGKHALDIVASTLLHGNEDTRRAAAEALADDPEEGHELLKEGAAMDDLLVRHATIFGLKRIGEPWAKEILEKLELEDDQWVVRNTAQRIVEEMAQPNPHIPQPPRPLSETPWLIAFAGERGIGISPGKPVQSLLLQALRDGNEEQQLAALEEYRQHGDASIIPTLYSVYYGSPGELRETALNTLWHMAASGLELPSPTKFGLG